MGGTMAGLLLFSTLTAMSLSCSAEIWLGTSPMGWEDFDSHTNAEYNESYARKVAAVQHTQLLPSGYDTFIIGGWSMGGQVLPNGSIPHYINTSGQYTLLDEYGRRECMNTHPSMLISEPRGAARLTVQLSWL